MEPEQATTPQTADEPVSPPVNPLIPEGIENFVPSCVVCRQPVPSRRATGRSKDTCSPACQKVLRKFREYNLKRTRCPACYHPSTPSERQDFIAWRKARGDRREGRGRPPLSREKNLRIALQSAVDLLKAHRAVVLDSNCNKDDQGKPMRSTLDAMAADEVAQLDCEISRSEKLLAAGMGETT